MFISKFRTALIGLLLLPCCLVQEAPAANALAAKGDENPASPGRVRLSEILIETPQPYSPEQVDKAQKKAEALLEEIRKGADFGHVALGASSEEVKVTVSDLGYLSRGELPLESENVVFRMKLGDISDVMRTKEGFVILKVTEIQEAAPSSIEAKPTEAWDFKVWIAIGAAFGTLVTGLTNLVRWWRERSLSHRIRELTSQILDLSRLLETLPLVGANTLGGLSGDPAPRIRRELTEMTTELITTLDRAWKLRMPPSGEMAFFRRWFLLFGPRGFRATVAHFAFYSWLVPLFYTVIGLAVVDPHLGFRTKLFSVIEVLFIALTFRYWAIVEFRWLNPSREEPSRLARALFWYTPQSLGELLARLCLFVAVWVLVVDAFFQLYVMSEALQTFGPYFQIRSNWTALISNAGLIASVVICYFWNRAEYRLHWNPAPRPRFPHNLRFLYRPLTIEGWCCQLLFYAMLALCVREVWLMRETLSVTRQMITDMYAGDLSTAGQNILVFANSLSAIILSAMHNVLPLYGAYRWGLAEFRTRRNVQAPAHEPVAKGPAPGQNSA